jgi:ABC-type nitrate/sulfonate/bicarbonate transport system permease component
MARLRPPGTRATPVLAPAPPRRARPADSIKAWATFPVGIVLLALILSVLKTAAAIPDFIFPHPARVLGRFLSTIANGSIAPDLAATVTESLSGFAIALAATVILAYGIAKSRLFSRLLMPYLIAANTIPSVALAPFLVLWLGFGLAPKIVTSVIVIFFPMLISNVSAFRLAEESTRDLVSFYRPRPLRRFAKFELPASLPLVSGGIKVSITLSVIGAVVGEFISGATGLGSLVSRAKAGFDVELMFVALVWLVLLGLAYFGAANAVLALLQRRRRTTAAAKGEDS